MDKPSIAILSRTNLGLRPFEQALTEQKIPYHLIGKSGYWATEEVKSAISFTAACLYPANHVISGMLRTGFWPVKYLPKSKISSRLKEIKAAEPEISYWKLMATEPSRLVDPKNLEALSSFTSFVHSLSRYRDLPAADALKAVLGALKAGDYYSAEEQIDNDPLANLAELVKIAGKFSSVKDFLDYCRKVTAASKSRKGVMLATVHSFKGMEADVVHVVGCQEGMMPHAKATDLGEERNIFFTACSRPRRKLVITYAGQASPFIVQYLQKSKEETQNDSTTQV